MIQSRGLNRPSWLRLKSLTWTSGLFLSKPSRRRSSPQPSKRKRLTPPRRLGRSQLFILRDPRNPFERLRKRNWLWISDEIWLRFLRPCLCKVLQLALAAKEDPPVRDRSA